MGSLALSIQYAKNTGLVLSSTELKNLYFTGIKLQDQFGNPIPQETIDFYIESAQKEIADYLNIKLTRQAYLETRDYMYDDWIKWAYMPTTYPVVKPLSLQGFLNTTLQVTYPQEWLSSKKQSPVDEDLYQRIINLVPVQGSTTVASGQSVYVGIAPLIGYWGNRTVPNYWSQMYLTGLNKIPADILRAIGMKASIPIFMMLGDIISGVPGLASKSIGIDGLSQSVTTTNTSGKSGGAFAGRVAGYEQQLDKLLPMLANRYRGIGFGVL